MNGWCGRLENNANFEMHEFVGRRIANLVAYRCDSEHPDSVDIVGILLHGAPYWHRFFLDARVGFWEELTEEDVFYDFDDCQRLDLTDRWPISE